MQVDETKTRPRSLRTHLYQQVQEQSQFCDVTVQVNSWVNTYMYITYKKLVSHFAWDELLNFNVALLETSCFRQKSDGSKVKVGNDQEMAHSERNSHSTNRRKGKKQNDM